MKKFSKTGKESHSTLEELGYQWKKFHLLRSYSEFEEVLVVTLHIKKQQNRCVIIDCLYKIHFKYKKNFIPQRNPPLSYSGLQKCGHNILWCNHPNLPEWNLQSISFFNCLIRGGKWTFNKDSTYADLLYFIPQAATTKNRFHHKAIHVK